MKETEHLFIYGTLAPGKVNHYVIADIPGVWKKASLRGVLYNEGWGADLGCPGLVPDDNADPVNGHVFSSQELYVHWARLDEFEGSEYVRQKVRVNLENGDFIDAYVYAIKN